MDTTDKVRETRLRRMAYRQGLILRKSRTRDPRAIGHGMYCLTDFENRAVAGTDLMGYSMNLDEIEVFLTDAQDFDVYFKDPLGGVPLQQLSGVRLRGARILRVHWGRRVGIVKPPEPDASLDAFEGGVGVLTRDGEVAGHIATTRGWFWTPFIPLRRQWWIWYIVVWADGTRESSTEDYPPWSAVDEMRNGYFEWEGADARRGRYDFRWLGQAEAQAVRERLQIDAESF